MTIRKRGNSFEILVSLGFDSKGKRIRKCFTFNPDPTMTKRQAEQAAYKYGIEIENKLKRGISVKNDSMTFDQFAELYFKDHASHLKEYTAVQYKDIYDRHIKSYFGDMRIKNIGAMDVRQWLSELESADKTKELTENSKGVYYRTLSSMFGVAVRWEIIDDNPCRRVTMPKSKQTRVKALQLEEFNDLFSKIDSYPDVRTVLLVYIFSMTGIREGEAAGLKWSDIDFENKIMHIEREVVYIPQKGVRITPPKSSTSIRDVYISEVLCEKLTEYKHIQDKEIEARGDLYQNEGYIISQFNGSPVHASSIRKMIKRAFEKIGVPYVGVHGLRHTYASLLTAAGVDIRTTAAQLGHSTPSITMNIYANPQNEAKRRAADVIGRLAKREN